MKVSTLFKNKYLLLLPALTINIIDVCVTGFFIFNKNIPLEKEAAPVIQYLLGMGLPIYTLAVISGVLLIGGIILFLPHFYARIFFLIVVIGNTWGACSWISYYLNYYLAILLLILTAVISIICLDKYYSHINKKSN